jgi:hypothetical protein
MLLIHYFRVCYSYLSIQALWDEVLGYCLDKAGLVRMNGTGAVSITQTFIQCLNNIADPVLWPGYDEVTQQALVITTQVALNNLIKIDEVSDQVQFDFFIRQYWFDPRLSIPALWEELNVNDTTTSIDITPILMNNYQTINGYQLGIYKPNMIFYDAVDMTVTDTAFKFGPKGYVYCTQHIIITLMQSNFEYQLFPDDVQKITMRWASLSLDPTQLKIQGMILVGMSLMTYMYPLLCACFGS